MICEREEEILKFIPEEYWSIKAEVECPNKPSAFGVNLVQVDSKRIVSPLKDNDTQKTMVIGSKAEVDQIINRIKSSKLSVSSLATKPSSKKPQPPFKTSTLQRAASNALGFSVKRTMQVAQSLYEGVKLGASDQVG
ncbi:MAG: DNA topoisomerase, partial [bacterium]